MERWTPSIANETLNIASPRRRLTYGNVYIFILFSVFNFLGLNFVHLIVKPGRFNRLYFCLFDICLLSAMFFIYKLKFLV